MGHIPIRPSKSLIFSLEILFNPAIKVLSTCFKVKEEGGFSFTKFLNFSFNHKSLSKYKKEYLFTKIINIKKVSKNSKNKTGPPLVNKSSNNSYTLDNK